MFNQIRAEFYKLFHTKALYLTFALILAVFGIFSIGGQQQFVASSSSLDETWKIGETVGFLARAYSDTAHPLIEEIIRTATSYTVFFWLIVLIFSVIFFSREYTDKNRRSFLNVYIIERLVLSHIFYFNRYNSCLSPCIFVVFITCVIYNLHVVGKKSLIDIPHWPEHYEVLSYHFWPAYRQNRLSVFVPEDRCIPPGEI